MALAHRVIPCLDVTDGRVVKGVRFEDLRDIGDPAELAWRYEDEGADELVFLDITATHEDRESLWDVVERTAENLTIPLTVGGGIRTVEDVHHALRRGADKVAINSAAVARPEVLTEGAEDYGRQCMVVAIDAKRQVQGDAAAGQTWHVYTHGGRRDTGMDALQWMREAEARGAGEVLLTSMDRDGTLDGYDLDLLAAAHDHVDIPIIASGGAGDARHLVEAVLAGADAVLAASIFHDRMTTVREVKDDMALEDVEVRLA